MKAIQKFETTRGDAPEYLRSSCTLGSDIHSRLLRSSFNFQLYTPNPYLEIHRNIFVFVQVHPFGIPYLHIFIIQIQFIILKPSIYVGLTPNDQ